MKLEEAITISKNNRPHCVPEFRRQRPALKAFSSFKR